jgi:hypothetical protein
MQTGHMGSSVDPAGGVVASSEEGVYCTEAINRTWHTSRYTMEQELIVNLATVSNMIRK